MFDVNKTVMRCLTKNLAMFGLGLYIYAGEDLPEGSEEDKQAKIEAQKKAAEALSAVVMSIEGRVKTLTASMDKAAKVAFADQYIVPAIGRKNYKACGDLAKLTRLDQLLAKLSTCFFLFVRKRA